MERSNSKTKFNTVRGTQFRRAQNSENNVSKDDILIGSNRPKALPMFDSSLHIKDEEEKMKPLLKEQKRLAEWRKQILQSESESKNEFAKILVLHLEEKEYITRQVLALRKLVAQLKEEITIEKEIRKQKEEKKVLEALEKQRLKEMHWAENFNDVPLVQTSKFFEIEFGDEKVKEESMVLIDAERYTPYYQHYFQKKPHINYYADLGSPFGPLIASVEIIEKEKLALFSEHTLKTRVLKDDEFVFISAAESGKSSSIEEAIKSQSKRKENLTGLKLVKINKPNVPDLLGQMEEKLIPKGYKIGILYCREEQTTEEEFYGNLQTSEAYREFLDFIGRKIELKGYSGYTGGLDVRNNSTGTHSIVSEVDGFQIMFHVSTLLPHSIRDKQQLERKRHIGNDVCIIVFRDSPETFDPQSLRSEFNKLVPQLSDVMAVISPDYSQDRRHYKVAFAYKGNMGKSSPRLPFPSIFEKNSAFRTFLLKKLVNSERVAFRGPEFRERLAKAKGLQMKSVLETLK